MRLFCLVSALTTFHAVFGDDIKISSTPRGVPYKQSPLYRNVDGNFQCLDGSRTILHSQVNDDYCDCADGSDEPGTSACPNGRFFCPNKGHEGQMIPSSRVNDKICDCCDGSDEYDQSVECPNVCEELGRSARLERERQREKQKKGFGAKEELAKTGQALKKDYADKLIPLKAERDELQPKKDEIEARKKEAEEKEQKLQNVHREAWEAEKKERRRLVADRLFNQFDKNGDRTLDLEEVKNIKYIDSDFDGIVSDDEANRVMPAAPVSYDQFLDTMYNNLKSAKREYRNHEEAAKEGEHSDNMDDLAPEDEDDLPEETDPNDQQKLSESRHEEEVDDEFNDLDDSALPAYDEETNKATADADEIRKEFTEIDNQISNIDRQIRESEQFMEHDYGEDMAWAALKGQCYELDEMQYTYKMCPFDKTVQKEKNGYGETSLGNWKEWSGGSGADKYKKQKYEDGQQCWNGPKRSTEVVIECGEETKLLEATEPAKCEYRFRMQTPAACNDPEKEPAHTEL